MAQIPMYERVQTQADLQQLITGTILRQMKPFTEMEIIEQVFAKVQGSPFEQKREDVTQKVGNTFKIMQIGSAIKSITSGAEEPRKWKISLPFPAYNAKMMLSKAK